MTPRAHPSTVHSMRVGVLLSLAAAGCAQSVWQARNDTCDPDSLETVQIHAPVTGTLTVHRTPDTTRCTYEATGAGVQVTSTRTGLSFSDVDDLTLRLPCQVDITVDASLRRAGIRQFAFNRTGDEPDPLWDWLDTGPASCGTLTVDNTQGTGIIEIWNYVGSALTVTSGGQVILGSAVTSTLDLEAPFFSVDTSKAASITLTSGDLRLTAQDLEGPTSFDLLSTSNVISALSANFTSIDLTSGDRDVSFGLLPGTYDMELEGADTTVDATINHSSASSCALHIDAGTGTIDAWQRDIAALRSASGWEGDALCP